MSEPSGLLGPNGQPIEQYARPKKERPIVGDAYAEWGGFYADLLKLPGGGALGFDTSRLTIRNFRKMREHYQIGSSLNVLSFMLHQLDWEVECDDAKIKKHCEYNLEKIWTRLIRAMSSAFAFGFSANAIEWDNDASEGKLMMHKIKDLLPEEVEVNWKYVDSAIKRTNAGGTKAPQVPIFDGIKRRGSIHKIQVENSFWYPLLMENGDYYGRQLLRTAFQPWFFSTLIHLYQNKYFERFGEPVPVGRAPYNDKVRVGDKDIWGYDMMAEILSNIRSRAAVVLPNTRSREGQNDTPEFDYQVEYLESQMRGADFERYLTRLDEEMSLALFTPLLLLRTADGGGFNQGIAHTQVYLWMLNAVAGDMAEYIDRYILRNMAVFNFGPNAKLPRIKFRKLGVAQQETLRAIVQTMIGKGEAKPDINELGQQIGLSLKEVEIITDPNLDDDPDSTGDQNPGDKAAPNGNKDGRIGRDKRLKNGDGPKSGTTTKVSARIAEQIEKQFAKGDISGLAPSPGHVRQLGIELHNAGVGDALECRERAERYNSNLIRTLTDAAALGNNSWSEEGFKKYADNVIEAEYEKIA